VQPEVVRKLRQIMGPDGLVVDETALLVYECDARENGEAGLRSREAGE
jgi:hypothetical protein